MMTLLLLSFLFGCGVAVGAFVGYIIWGNGQINIDPAKVRQLAAHAPQTFMANVLKIAKSIQKDETSKGR